MCVTTLTGTGNDIRYETSRVAIEECLPERVRFEYAVPALAREARSHHSADVQPPQNIEQHIYRDRGSIKRVFTKIEEDNM